MDLDECCWVEPIFNTLITLRIRISWSLFSTRRLKIWFVNDNVLEVSITSWTIWSNKVEDTVSQPPVVEVGGYNEYPTCSSYYSKVNSSIEWCVMQSQIVSTKVMTMDMEGHVNFLYVIFLYLNTTLDRCR